MNLIYLEIVLRLEDYLNNQLENSNFKNYEIAICGNDEIYEYELLKKGLVYDTIYFNNGGERLDKNSDEFWRIIKFLEQKRTIKSRLDNMVNHIKKTSPELLYDETPMIVSDVNDWIIYGAFILIVLTLIFNFSKVIYSFF